MAAAIKLRSVQDRDYLDVSACSVTMANNTGPGSLIKGDERTRCSTSSLSLAKGKEKSVKLCWHYTHL